LGDRFGPQREEVLQVDVMFDTSNVGPTLIARSGAVWPQEATCRPRRYVIVATERS
jgi:hypothetical protein